MKRVFRLFLFFLSGLGAACSSPDQEAGDECGPNGQCPPGFTCDPVDRRCIAVGGGGIDAGAPDAMTQLGCPTPTGGPTIHATEIKADEVWTANGSPHIVNGQIRVTGTTTLTIEPCAEVQIAKEGGIVTGFGGAMSTLRALGTAAQPIVVKQKTEGMPFDGLEAQYPGTLDLAYVTIEGGGSNRFRRGAGLTGWGNLQAPPKPVVKVDHVTVRGSAGTGVNMERFATFAPGSTGLTVTGSGADALYIEMAAAGDVPDGSYGDNPIPAVTIYGGAVDTALALRPLGVPYRLADFTGITVKTGGALALAAGVELIVPKAASIDVRDGSLTAAGTAEKPVRIHARSDAAEDRWLHLEVDHPGTASLVHTIIEGSGSDRFTFNASLVARGDSADPLKANLHVDGLTVKGSGGIGVLVERKAAFDDTSRDLVISGAAAEAARIATPAVHTLPSGSYTGNGHDGIVLDSAQPIAAEERIPDRGVPYFVTSSISVRPPTQDKLARLTIEPGVELRFPKGLYGVVLGAGGTGSAPWPAELVAEGTAEKPIVFTSAEAAPAAGDWRGIYFMGYRETGNKIAHARIEYAGASCLCSVGGCGGPEEAGVMFFFYPLAEKVVTQSTFAHIAGHGIYSNLRSQDPEALDMTSDNTFEDVSGCGQTMVENASGQCTRMCM